MLAVKIWSLNYYTCKHEWLHFEGIRLSKIRDDSSLETNSIPHHDFVRAGHA